MYLSSYTSPFLVAVPRRFLVLAIALRNRRSWKNLAVPPKPDLKSQIENFQDPRRLGQKPVGWWQDSAGTPQPPGSYVDSSQRVGKRLGMKDKLLKMLGAR